MKRIEEHLYTLTETELLELIEGLESACDMMEPYYAQCNADRPLREIVSKYRAMIPVEEQRDEYIHCPVCDKKFKSIEAVVQHSSVKHSQEYGTASRKRDLRRSLRTTGT